MTGRRWPDSVEVIPVSEVTWAVMAPLPVSGWLDEVVAVGDRFTVRSGRYEGMTGLAVGSRRAWPRTGRRPGAAAFVRAVGDEERERDAQ